MEGFFDARDEALLCCFELHGCSYLLSKGLARLYQSGTRIGNWHVRQFIAGSCMVEMNLRIDCGDPRGGYQYQSDKR